MVLVVSTGRSAESVTTQQHDNRSYTLQRWHMHTHTRTKTKLNRRPQPFFLLLLGFDLALGFQKLPVHGRTLQRQPQRRQAPSLSMNCAASALSWFVCKIISLVYSVLRHHFKLALLIGSVSRRRCCKFNLNAPPLQKSLKSIHFLTVG